MLKQRVFTALIMLAIVLPTLFFSSPWPFCALALLFIAAGAWEWAKLNGMQKTGAIYFAGLFIVLAALGWYLGFIEQSFPKVWIMASGFWVLVSVWLLKTGVSGWTQIPVILRRVGGMLALLLAWLAVVQARVQGVNFLMSILVLVWVADSFAYFAGRAWGGKFTSNKLAPSISPGKSWEGVWGGVLGVFLLAMSWAWADSHWQTAAPSLYHRLQGHHFVFMAIALLFLTAMSVVGDLIESLIKRSAGVKDSSDLLPGHGGVLDRIDALLPTLPIALMLASWVN
jgi:phosphatidate cytidylyltransferase